MYMFHTLFGIFEEYRTVNKKVSFNPSLNNNVTVELRTFVHCVYFCLNITNLPDSHIPQHTAANTIHIATVYELCMNGSDTHKSTCCYANNVHK